MTKENKEIREMELKLHVAWNHYTLCMYDAEDRENYPPVQMKEEGC